MSRERIPGPPGGAWRVLVVEDDPFGCELLERLLRKHPIDVTSALDGAEALRALEGGTFDVVLCDLRMPGMGGQEFYRLACERHPGLAERVIFVTGDMLSPEVQEFFRETGCRKLEKPFGSDKLVEVVREALGV